MSFRRRLLFTLTSLVALNFTIAKYFLKPPYGFGITHIELPYLVSVQVHGWHVCGGTIIAPQWILTAAFCTNGLIAKSLTVRVGSKSYRRGGSIIQVKDIIQPDEYVPSIHDYDFSLLQLVEPLNFTNRIQSIGLPNAADTFEDNRICLVAGWGDPKNAGSCRDSFHATFIPIINQEECREDYISIHNITNRMICAGKGNAVKSTCRGDEGSPLLCGNSSTGYANILTGIVSWAENCGDPQYPGVYSRLQAVRSWIQNITGI